MSLHKFINNSTLYNNLWTISSLRVESGDVRHRTKIIPCFGLTTKSLKQVWIQTLWRISPKWHCFIGLAWDKLSHHILYNLMLIIVVIVNKPISKETNHYSQNNDIASFSWALYDFNFVIIMICNINENKLRNVCNE